MCVPWCVLTHDVLTHSVCDVLTHSVPTGAALQVAPMSTTAELDVALRYCISNESLLFKIETANFMERGASLSFLSCFPGESEYLFAPLTYLRPTGRQQLVQFDADATNVSVKMIVFEVTPTFGT
jgi:hypothetical protein